eukprot:TRINITY_DN31812_c0_g1_i1.p1 TRINITY_DN31812_c0_g1~~TRINITY_DN31812_c0_g1_i1.p1  ORF type:complete len:325 (+),score=30.69 TRINITY_DN31812_c0_g1_i1:144-1118(+)
MPLDMLNILLTMLLASLVGSVDEPSCSLSGACAEHEVEAWEGAMIQTERQELLQHSLRISKLSETNNLAQRYSADQERTHNTASQKRSSALHRLFKRRRTASAKEDPTGPSSGPVNCSAYPMFCNSKVDCATNPLTPEERKTYDKQLATASGKANLRTWCLAYPMYSTSVQKCIVEGDSQGYARATFETQKKLKLLDADAIYCFVAGHCNNTEVTDSTTVEQAEAICDRRYGRERWASIGFKDFMDVLGRALKLGNTHQVPKEWHVTGFGSPVKLARHETDIMAMTACAMGNYRCDVAYCQTNYCNEPSYRARFGNFSWTYFDS